MALRATSTTRFEGPVQFVRVIPLNQVDKSTTSPALGGNNRVVSNGAGPWDFTPYSASISALGMSFKTDNGTVITKILNLSSFTLTAITVANLVAAMVTATPPTGWTSAVEAVTGYWKLSLTTPGTAKYIQVYGDVADAIGITAKIIPVDTQKSSAVEPTIVDSARLETQDSKGLITAIISPAYKTGDAITLTDSAMDQELRALLEGGTLVTVSGYAAKQYKGPGPASTAKVFAFEMYSALYVKDDQQEANIAGYRQRTFKSCVASKGGIPGDRNFQDGVYNISAVPYYEPSTGVKDAGSEIIQDMTVAEYLALNLGTV